MANSSLPPSLRVVNKDCVGEREDNVTCIVRAVVTETQVCISLLILYFIFDLQ